MADHSAGEPLAEILKIIWCSEIAVAGKLLWQEETAEAGYNIKITAVAGQDIESLLRQTILQGNPWQKIPKIIKSASAVQCSRGRHCPGAQARALAGRRREDCAGRAGGRARQSRHGLA